jgi:hypothetical protein
MDEPTDRALKLQGLKRAEYDSMSQEGKEVISSRSRRLTELADIMLAAELLNSLAETDESSKTYIGEALEGKHPFFSENIRQIIDEYVDSDVETSIKEFYKIKYSGKKGIITASIERELVRQDLNGGEPAPEDKTEESSQPLKSAEIPAITAAKIEHINHSPQPTTSEDRMLNIAMILSQREKTNPDRIMRTETDIIKRIMTITDENKALNLTDESVCKAAETLIKNVTNGIQFYGEALSTQNRELLIQTAKAFI